MSLASSLPNTRTEWQEALESLPSDPSRIPAFFFGHGSPLLAFPESTSALSQPLVAQAGPNGPLAHFLRDLGPALLNKYKPKGILVFSAHWETSQEVLVTDYGDENPLLMDYYGFQPELYQLKFVSRGDAGLSQRVVEQFKKASVSDRIPIQTREQDLLQAGIPARTTPTSESRGRDGRGFDGPGLDHGVFVPFRLMFGEKFLDVPIVQASIDASLSPEKNWAVGKAIAPLRSEGILVLSGGLTVHNLRDRSSMAEASASDIYKTFDQAVLSAAAVADPTARKKALVDLTSHPGFRPSHPREDHFVPLYVAAGAGGDGHAKIVSAVYGAPTVAFGL